MEHLVGRRERAAGLGSTTSPGRVECLLLSRRGRAEDGKHYRWSSMCRADRRGHSAHNCAATTHCVYAPYFQFILTNCLRRRLFLLFLSLSHTNIHTHCPMFSSQMHLFIIILLVIIVFARLILRLLQDKWRQIQNT
jgi:hypothetical protein